MKIWIREQHFTARRNVLSPVFTFVKLKDEIETKHNHQQPTEVTIRVPSLVVDTKQNEQQ